MATSPWYSHSVLDLSPWPSGLGFTDAETWWAYVLSRSEDDKLNLLITVALLSEEITLLLLNHDQDLLERFEFSETVLSLLCGIDAATLVEFSQALISKRRHEA